MSTARRLSQVRRQRGLPARRTRIRLRAPCVRRLAGMCVFPPFRTCSTLDPPNGPVSPAPLWLTLARRQEVQYSPLCVPECADLCNRCVPCP